MKVRILTRLNSPYGTFEAGEMVTSLPDDLAKAWVESGIAEVPDQAAAVALPIPDPPPPDNLEPVTPADRTGTRSSRRRVPATHPSSHEGPMREDPKRPQ